MKTRVAVVSLTAILALSACGTDPVVCNTGEKLSGGVCVTIVGSFTPTNTQGGTVTYTNKTTGATVLGTNLVPGTYIATLSKSGFQSQQQEFTVAADGTTTPSTFAFATLVANPVVITNGSVAFTVPTGTTMVVKDANGVVVPAANYTNLAPGKYSVVLSRSGYMDRSIDFTVTSGQTTVISALDGWKEPQQVAYYVKNGQRVDIPASATASSFKFTAWLENRDANSVRSAGLVPGSVGQMGAEQTASAQEVTERAPYGSQNLVGAYMQYNDGGTWYPVVGAEVGWELLQSNLTTATTDPNFNPEPTGYDLYDDPAIINEIIRRGTLVRFTAADDGSQPGGPLKTQWINANALSAWTVTNSATGNNIPFPNTSNFMTYNQLGLSTPNLDGFTWTAIQDQRNATYVPNTDPFVDPEAVPPVPQLEGRVSQVQVRAIGYVNGMEINKVFLEKNFVPAADLRLKKDVIGGEEGKINGSKSFRITITNNSPVPANNVRLTDMLQKDAAGNYIGAPGNYAIRGVRGFLYSGTESEPGSGTFITDAEGLPVGAVETRLADGLFTLTGAPGSTIADDGFNVGNDTNNFNIPAFSVVRLEFDAQGTVAGRYCDIATISRYSDGNLGDYKRTEDGSRNKIVNTNIWDDACMTLVSEPALTVDKEAGLVINGTFVPFTSPRFQVGGDLYNDRRIDPNEPVTIRVIVKNTGSEVLNNVTLNDALTSGNAAAHVITVPTGATANGNDGFDLAIGTLAPNQTREYRFTASASERGRYCDTVTVKGTPVNKAEVTATDDACFTVDIIRFTKVNQVIRNGRLVDAEGRSDIRRDEIILTTVTLVNDADTKLDNVRLYDRMALGRTNGLYALYEDRHVIIDPITQNLRDDDGNLIRFERVDAYDTKTAVLGTLTAAKFNQPGNLNTAGSVPLPTPNDPNGDNGRLEQWLNANVATAVNAPVTLVRSDDTVINLNEYNPGGSANFDFSNSATRLREAAPAAMPGYSLDANQQLTLRFFSRLPDLNRTLRADTYCNVAWWNFGNITDARTGEPNRFDEIEKCVSVQRLLSFQQNVFDTALDGTNIDNFAKNETIRYRYEGRIEVSSTQGAKANVFTISHGTTTDNAANPLFTIDRHGVSPTTVTVYDQFGVLRGTQPSFTQNFAAGVRTVTLDPAYVLNPGDYVVINSAVAAPTTVAGGLYNTTVDWNSTGDVDNLPYRPTSLASEPTTIDP